MHDKLPADWIALWLDGELSPEERAVAEMRLQSDPVAMHEWVEARDLDVQLRAALPVPTWDETAFLERSSSRHTALTPSPSPGGRGEPEGRASRNGSLTRRPLVALLTVAACLLLAMVLLHSEGNPAVASVATLTHATGPVEVRQSTETEWTRVAQPHNLALAAGAHVRTPAESLCEVTTPSQGLVRVNQQTEFIVHRPEEIELVNGQFWCRAAAQTPLMVSVPGKANVEPSAISGHSEMCLFTCPSSSETLWRIDDQVGRCIAVSDQPTELRGGADQTWTIPPGQSMACTPGGHHELSGYYDRLQATSWQLPLLNTRPPHDPDLQGMLQGLLAEVGMTKVSSFDSSQIRSLGPAGTLPLIAFVRSPESRTRPELRHRAMAIVADLAPASTRSDLEVLATDADPEVARLAHAALIRISRSNT